jgi:hypothetical protein
MLRLAILASGWPVSDKSPVYQTWEPAADEVDIPCFSSHDEVEGVL